MKADRSFWIEIPLAEAWPLRRGTVTITIAHWQEADEWHRACYETGGVVLDVDADEIPFRAYRKGT